MFEMFVAGPTNKKISPIPGDIPFNIKDAAIGVEAEAQIYIGIPTTRISNRPVIPDRPLKKFTGIKISINADTIIPIDIQTAISSKRSKYPYLRDFMAV